MKNQADSRSGLLWYDAPAGHWEEALPLGNARLAAMVFGGSMLERVQLNEETLWDGQPHENVNPRAREHLTRVRKLLLAGEPVAAEEGTQECMMGIPNTIRPYQTLGDLWIQLDGHAYPVDYRRELDLSTATARVSYRHGAGTFNRECWISAPDQVLVYAWQANGAPWPEMRIRLSRPADASAKARPDGTLELTGRTPHGDMPFAALARVKTDGEIRVEGETVMVREATRIDLRLVAGTDYRDRGADPLDVCYARIKGLESRTLTSLKTAQEEAYRKLFDRVELHLDTEEPNGDDLPTNLRLLAVKNGRPDPGLERLLFDYGRYLLIASSLPGSLPANLQGKWNPHLDPIWHCDYHLNINLQMNYWPAEVANLSECHEPLFDLLETLVEPGQRMARNHYGCNGFVVHHITDIWGYVSPADGYTTGLWPMGAAWIVLHAWEHWLFKRDLDFLRARGFPLLKEAALFLLDYLVELPDGSLATVPSSSPENGYLLPDGSRAFLCVGATMDMQICRELFNACLAACELLDLEKFDFRNRVAEALSKLPPARIGEDGRLLEWREPFDEIEPGHRHVSHLFGLYPGSQIDPEQTPSVAAAARKTLDFRLAHGGAHTGWSRAWMINFFARLRDGDAAHDHLVKLLQSSTLPNLFNDHPPFQIDGNFGACAGICEMLLQSHGEEIVLLPALPAAWPNGRVRGLRARGGLEVAIDWADGAVVSAEIQATTGGEVRIGSASREPLSADGAPSIPVVHWPHTPGQTLRLTRNS